MHDREPIRRKYELLKASLDERTRRLWAGAEAHALGHGGVAAVAEATGLAISTVVKGRKEVREGTSSSDVVRIRRRGAGRPRLEDKDPKLKVELGALVEASSRGDPESALRWTLRSTRVLSRELTSNGHPISPNKVGELLHEEGYSLQGTSRVKEGEEHPDRDAQFEHINVQANDFMARGVPVVSVDAKKKELVGDYANAGREWHPKGKAIEVRTYDFPDPNTRKAIPYGVYDLAENIGYVNVGTDHDTSAFAARSLENWWTSMGMLRYPNATELFVTADGGGSNGYRSHIWKARLQDFSDRHSLTLHVSHFPPGTSKWNKIEHRLFSFITLNWRGRPLTTFETVVSLIAATTTAKGLRVMAQLDTGKYPLGESVSKEAMAALALHPKAFRGEWNYTICPRTPDQLASLAVARAHKPRKNRRAADWHKLISEQLASGQSAADFCRRSKLKYDQFTRQRSQLVGPLQPHDMSKWPQLFKDQASSGMPATDFCRLIKVPYGSFLRARRKLAHLRS